MGWDYGGNYCGISVFWVDCVGFAEVIFYFIIQVIEIYMRSIDS